MTVSRKTLSLTLIALLSGAAAWSIAQQLPATAAPQASKALAAKPLDRPTWAELTPAQRMALEPLAAEWNNMEKPRKQKWLEIAGRFTKMKPDEQQRLQEKMREWMKLTPEQRRTARETYTRTKKIDTATKVTEWDKYQQLPEEQKKALADKAASKKTQVAALPAPSQAKGKTVEPIKKKTNPSATATAGKPATPPAAPVQAPPATTPPQPQGQPVQQPAPAPAAQPPVAQPAAPAPATQPANGK
jgi:hypothetical protein